MKAADEHPHSPFQTMSNELTPDQAAAHEFLSELRTRISTQPLPYQYGVEARALESLWEVFGQAREAMKKHPGCKEFAAAVTHALNINLRPMTAKWDRAHATGRLDSRDGADEFRGDLEEVQKRLREFAELLHEMAYGSKARDELGKPVMTGRDLKECVEELPFGIPRGTRGLRDEDIDAINSDEAEEVRKRRAAYGIEAFPGKNAVGVGFSGGGIRSATFCLGVTQVLAARGLLKDVDFLSTVSGGGYTGSFLTARLGTKASLDDVAAPHGPDPGPIRYVRHHANIGYQAFKGWLGWSGWKAPAAGVSLIGTLLAAGPAIVQFFPLLQKPRIRQAAMKVLLWAAGLVGPLIALLLFYALKLVGDLPGDPTRPVWSLDHYGGAGALSGFAAILAAVVIWLLNINLTAPHRLYRDRLAKTFIHTRDSGDAAVPLTTVNNSARAPYHLINTTLNLPASEAPALRDRKCAFFLFSKYWSGSATTGYHRTSEPPPRARCSRCERSGCRRSDPGRPRRAFRGEQKWRGQTGYWPNGVGRTGSCRWWCGGNRRGRGYGQRRGKKQKAVHGFERDLALSSMEQITGCVEFHGVLGRLGEQPVLLGLKHRGAALEGAERGQSRPDPPGGTRDAGRLVGHERFHQQQADVLAQCRHEHTVGVAVGNSHGRHGGERQGRRHDVRVQERIHHKDGHAMGKGGLELPPTPITLVVAFGADRDDDAPGGCEIDCL
jgi:lipid-A-disaccharide synthase-like uncharacterized protein